MDFDKRLDDNYNEIRYCYEEYLVEDCDYTKHMASISDDGWDEFVMGYYEESGSPCGDMSLQTIK